MLSVTHAVSLGSWVSLGCA